MKFRDGHLSDCNVQLNLTLVKLCSICCYRDHIANMLVRINKIIIVSNFMIEYSAISLEYYGHNYNEFLLEVRLLPKNNVSVFYRLLFKTDLYRCGWAGAPLSRFLEGAPYKFLNE